MEMNNQSACYIPWYGKVGKTSKIQTTIFHLSDKNGHSWMYAIWCFGVVIFLVNTFQLYVMFKDKKTRRSKPMVLIFNLTVSDIFFSLFMITDIALEYEKQSLEIDCRTYKKNLISQYLIITKLKVIFKVLAYRSSFLMSLLNNLAIACDRLHCVLRPIKYWQYKKQKYLIIVCILMWIASSIITALYLTWEFTQAGDKVISQVEVILSMSTPIIFSVFFLFVYGFIIFTYKRKSQNNTEILASSSSNSAKIHQRKQESTLIKLSLIHI